MKYKKGDVLVYKNNPTLFYIFYDHIPGWQSDEDGKYVPVYALYNLSGDSIMETEKWLDKDYELVPEPQASAIKVLFGFKGD